MHQSLLVSPASISTPTKPLPSKSDPKAGYIPKMGTLSPPSRPKVAPSFSPYPIPPINNAAPRQILQPPQPTILQPSGSLDTSLSEAAPTSPRQMKQLPSPRAKPPNSPSGTRPLPIAKSATVRFQEVQGELTKNHPLSQSGNLPVSPRRIADFPPSPSIPEETSSVIPPETEMSDTLSSPYRPRSSGVKIPSRIDMEKTISNLSD
jgi:hypothetical protein